MPPMARGPITISRQFQLIPAFSSNTRDKNNFLNLCCCSPLNVFIIFSFSCSVIAASLWCNVGIPCQNMGCCDSGRLTHCSASGLIWGNFSSIPTKTLSPSYRRPSSSNIIAHQSTNLDILLDLTPSSSVTQDLNTNRNMW